VSVAVEKWKLARAPQAKFRGRSKGCPFRPCPALIPERWLACEFHWSFASPQHRNGNRNGGREDHWLWVYSTVLGLVEAASALEAAGVPMPGETEQRVAEGSPSTLSALAAKAGHRARANCACDWCAPLYRWALKVAGVGVESWQKAVARYAP